jgi:hypothetical protein
MKRLIAAAAAAVTLGGLPAPAAAQDGPQDEARVNQLIIYGDDECPVSTGDEITVCARLDESERYRIPPDLRRSEDPANQPWTNRVQSFEAVGNFGPLSCTPVGLGGELGCTAQMIEAAFQERANSNTVRMSELVARAREERLSTIDAEAAATQARVEQIEREYMERAAREEAEATGGSLPSEDANPEILDGE